VSASAKNAVHTIPYLGFAKAPPSCGQERLLLLEELMFQDAGGDEPVAGRDELEVAET
jgi:hypothetical protein